MKMCDLPLNTTGIIDKIECTGILHRRLLDLGLVKGTKIIPVFRSPSGDPTAYEVRKTIIALRKDDSKFIQIKE